MFKRLSPTPLDPKERRGKSLADGETIPSDQSLMEWDERLVLKESPEEGLSIWEFRKLCIVLGRGSKLEEVNVEQCKLDDVPIHRRCSGGATIVAGPGCLMYSVVLSLVVRPELKGIDRAHRFVMTKMLNSLQTLDRRVQWRGSCDLTIDDRKFSGNALRYRKDWLLYHGTILYDFSLESITRYLRSPPREPTYRDRRSHADFVINFDASRTDIIRALENEWLAPEVPGKV